MRTGCISNASRSTLVNSHIRLPLLYPSASDNAFDMQTLYDYLFISIHADRETFKMHGQVQPATQK